MGIANGRGSVPAVVAAILMLLPALALCSSTATAAEITYVITSEDVNLYLSKDGSASLNYDIHVTVRPQSDSVDHFVIHMPNWQFEPSSSTVSLDGRTLKDIKKTGARESDMLITLGPANALPAGTVHSLSVVTDVGAIAMKHPSDGNKARISFTPTWWDPNEVQLVQNVKVGIHLTEDFLDTAAISYTDGANVTVFGERIVLTWTYKDVPPEQRIDHRVDIPRSAVDKVYDEFWDIEFHYYQNYLLLVVILVLVGVAYVAIKRALRKPYIKPYLNLEGWGTRKGFGPMEAAFVLGLPRERVAAMFLVDLVMVDAIEVKDPERMEVTVKNPDHEGRSAPFLGCIRNGRLDPIATTNFLGSLQDEVLAKLEGYDVEETKAHYATQGGTRRSRPGSGRQQPVDDVLWLMTDPRSKKRFKEAPVEGVPAWTSWKVTL